MSQSIVLIHPPQPTSLDDRLNPPMGLMYIAAYLEYNGSYSVRVVDLSSVPQDEWGDCIGLADVYGCTMYTTSYSVCRSIAAITKEINPTSSFVVGGAHPTTLPWRTAQEEWVDGVIVGEGEHAFLEMLGSGLLRPGSSEVVLRRKLSSGAMEYLQVPALDSVDMSTYSRQLNDRRAPALYTYRGCQYSCSFCSKDVHGHHPRYYTTEHVDAILRHYKDGGYQDLVIWDSFFTNRRSRWYPIADRIHDMGFEYRCNGRIGVDSPTDFRKLVDTGCVLFNIGLESGSQYIIDRMNKRFTIGHARDYINQVRDAGLTYRVFLQFGFPGETKHTMEETMRFIEDVDIDQYSCFTHNPFPGCDVYRNPGKYGVTWLSDDWDDYYTIAGDDGLGGMPFETEWLSRGEAMELNREFVQFLRARKWRGPVEEYHGKVGIGGP